MQQEISTSAVANNIELVNKLRRLANALEKAEPFALQLDGHDVKVPEQVDCQWHHAQDQQQHIDIRLSW